VRVHVGAPAWQLDYLLAASPAAAASGSVYELAFDGDLAERCASRLVAGAAWGRVRRPTFAGPGASPSQAAQPQSLAAGFAGRFAGRFAASSPDGGNLAVPARPDAEILALAAALPESAVLEGLPPPSHRNGTSYPAARGL
jgi:hypothetical protein